MMKLIIIDIAATDKKTTGYLCTIDDKYARFDRFAAGVSPYAAGVSPYKLVLLSTDMQAHDSALYRRFCQW